MNRRHFGLWGRAVVASGADDLATLAYLVLVAISLVYAVCRLYLDASALVGAGCAVAVAAALLHRFADFRSEAIFADLRNMVRSPVFIACLSLYAVCLAAGLTLAPLGGDDAWTNWGPKALILAAERFAPDSIMSTYQPGYPLFLPSLNAILIVVTGAGLGTASWLSAFLFSMLIPLGLYAFVARLAGRGQACLAAALYMFSPAATTVSALRIADPPVALALLLFTGLCYRADQREDAAWAWPAYCVLASALWIKNEGALIFFAFALARMAAGRRRFFSRELVPCLTTGCLAVAFFLLYKAGTTFQNEIVSAHDVDASLRNLFSWPRYVQSVESLARTALWPLNFGPVFWLPPILAVVALFRKRIPVGCVWWFAGCALTFAGYLLVLTLQPNDLSHFLNTALERLLFHAYPAMILATALAFHDLGCDAAGGARGCGSGRNALVLSVVVVLAILAVGAFRIGNNREMHVIEAVNDMASTVEKYKEANGTYLPTIKDAAPAPSYFPISPPVVMGFYVNGEGLMGRYVSDGASYSVCAPLSSVFGYKLLHARFPEQGGMAREDAAEYCVSGKGPDNR